MYRLAVALVLCVVLSAAATMFNPVNMLIGIVAWLLARECTEK